MSNFLGAPIGSAITGAVAIVIGIFVFGLLGWFEEPTPWSYVLGAIAGFVGGYLGGVFRQRRENR